MNDPRPQLITIAKNFYDRKWMYGTAGNLSARTSNDSIWITASGQNKGELTQEHFLKVDLSGKILYSPPKLRPSAETSIHTAVYKKYPDMYACLHVHMLESNWVCEDYSDNKIPLAKLEMLKGFGWKPSMGTPCIHVIENFEYVPKIAEEMDTILSPNDIIPGFLIRGHGITAWGKNIQEARNRLELFSYIFSFMCRR